jgi:hypothetical protein
MNYRQMKRASVDVNPYDTIVFCNSHFWGFLLSAELRVDFPVS